MNALDPLTLRIWPGTGEWTLYEDDGHTFEYRTAGNNYLPCTCGWTTSERGDPVVIANGHHHRVKVIVQLAGVGEQRFQDDGTARRLTF